MVVKMEKGIESQHSEHNTVFDPCTDKIGFVKPFPDQVCMNKNHS